MDFTLKYPTQGGGAEERIIRSGQVIFLVGPNGSGKSTLMHLLSNQHQSRYRRISAHRQVWFNSDTVDLTPARRQQAENNIANIDRNEQSIWKDQGAPERSQAIIFDLVESENVYARKIAEAARAGNMGDVEELASQDAPIANMNEILRLSNLDFQVVVGDGGRLLAVKEGSPGYSIAQLSDGERNALLIIANVLTAPDNYLIFIDEPERHLHRSIASPLISTLIAYRSDCAFIVSTHDVSLPHDQESANVLLLRSYSNNPKGWQVDWIESVEDLDEDIATAILGSRRVLLFVEGDASSLDAQIYHILYPHVTVKPLGSCVEVERVVAGIRSSEGNHWVSAFGVIDRDNRSDDECEALSSKGVLPLKQYSIESLYYHPVVYQKICERVALVNDIDCQSVLNKIKNDVVRSVSEHRDRLVARLVQRKVKEDIDRQSPDWKEILEGGREIFVNSREIFDAENRHMESLLESEDVESLVSRYPLRETPALQLIASNLLFPSKERYEQAVRKRLLESNDLADTLRNILSPVTDAVCE